MVQRRTFLKALAGGVAGLSAVPALAGLKHKPLRLGKGGGLKKLVVLFQRGGNDGLNTLIPVSSAEYNHYRSLRPTLGFTSAQLSNVPGSSFFRMHPALDPLLPAMNAGHFSFIHAVAYPGSDRSHFESQSYYETAIPGNGISAGWLNRFLANTTGPGSIRGLHIGNNIPQMASGQVPVPVSTNFGRLTMAVDNELEGVEDEAMRQNIRAMYNFTPTAGNEAVYNTGQRIFDMLDSFSTRDREDYQPENGAQYPDTGLGDRVMHAAQMLKDDDFLGVEVVTIDQGGYDTHAAQINPANLTDGETRHQELLSELAQSMAAFYADMGPVRMQDVMFLVVTEFGRRAYQNDSNGTDHGTGSLAMVMGGGLNGTHIGGDDMWPTLGELHRNHDLGWTTDFRDIYWEIMRNHMGVNDTTLDTIIPGHTFNSVGIIT
ncbi:DUF1501 domain-containing protein [Acanthopleuribacter pedis]|uniref:DUF1501 domain-containing protein n=1 Tax=Acanthopleuribacter pedis TaxID=442870 RepID=A0A8J7U5V6_9BACT|nr:DUF1501 domain-containing protein [Acanthopleuribacter pedis]MBO1322953.1 DUF1501 domain-containing protein [Acanthopleuribacter pedis]